MNDFETRARAAARAIRDTVDSSAPVVVAPRKSRGPIRALAIAAIVTVIAVVGTTLVVDNRTAETSSSVEIAAFCSSFRSAIGGITSETIRRAPQELGPDLRVLRKASRVERRGSRREQQATIEALVRVQSWSQINCYPRAAEPNAGPADRRYAPIGNPNFRICAASNRPAKGSGRRQRGAITIYGDRTLPDPFAGPLIAVTKNGASEMASGQHRVDIATGGEISDLAGLFGSMIPGGRALFWEDRYDFFVMAARNFPTGPDGELVRLSSAVRTQARTPRIPESALPQGWGVLYSGPLIEGSGIEGVALDRKTTYMLVAEGLRATITGSVPEYSESDTIRFFAPLADTRIAGALVGTIRNRGGDGSLVYLARWREPNGVIITLRSEGKKAPSPRQLRALIRSTRQLDRDQWVKLITDASPTCAGAVALGLSAPTQVDSSATSTTGPPGP